jgi:nucleoside-diphosphate-sugar epimerase
MIFITGGTGLVGAHILLKLAQEGKSVRALKRKTSSFSIVEKIFNYYNQSELLQKIEWIDGDLLDILSLQNAIEGCDDVIHCAALVSFDSKEVEKMMQFNVEGTANIVNTCIKFNVPKLAYVSSIAALGNSDSDIEKTEDNYWKPNSHNTAYSVSKYLSEQEVWRGTQEGLDAVIVNPSVILGPGDWSKGSSQLFEKVWDGLKYFTTGSTGYVDVIDVANVIVRLSESDVVNERFILNSENLAYSQVFEWIAEDLNRPKPHIKVTPFIKELAWRLEWVKSIITRKSPLITKETANKSMVNSSYSNAKISKTLSYKFIPIRESIQKYSRWFLSEKTIS